MDNNFGSELRKIASGYDGKAERLKKLENEANTFVEYVLKEAKLRAQHGQFSMDVSRNKTRELLNIPVYPSKKDAYAAMELFRNNIRDSLLEYGFKGIVFRGSCDKVSEWFRGPNGERWTFDFEVWSIGW